MNVLDKEGQKNALEAAAAILSDTDLNKDKEKLNTALLLLLKSEYRDEKGLNPYLDKAFEYLVKLPNPTLEALVGEDRKRKRDTLVATLSHFKANLAALRNEKFPDKDISTSFPIEYFQATAVAFANVNIEEIANTVKRFIKVEANKTHELDDVLQETKLKFIEKMNASIQNPMGFFRRLCWGLMNDLYKKGTKTFEKVIFDENNNQIATETKRINHIGYYHAGKKGEIDNDIVDIFNSKSPLVEERLIKENLKTALQSNINTLKEKDCDKKLTAYMQEKSLKEAAEVLTAQNLAISEQQLKNDLQTCRSRLRRLLEAQPDLLKEILSVDFAL